MKKNSQQNPQDELPIEELPANSAKMVVETCMDIRRGENVLIVCDPTTGEIGQALHEATIKKSHEHVLLIVMPKAKHHGEEPPTPVANLMRQQQVVLAPTKYSLTTPGLCARQ